jgi:hypothetical protein
VVRQLPAQYRDTEMNKVIVTTTINPPTRALSHFDSLADWTLVVIGDLKTPKDYSLAHGMYVGPDEQEKYDKALSDAIGWNCIQRRNFGLLIARELKADIVALVDDDNIPLDNWGEDLLIGHRKPVNFYEHDGPAFDPVGATNYPHLWHRGFPIQLLKHRRYSAKIAMMFSADIQADFWNGDPDIDAFCRMEHAPECTFDPGCFPIASNKPAPFNSQNSFLSAKVLPHYFLFPHIGRMDDIWAAYYVQALGFKVVFNRASVYQERNPHDLTKDMQQEYLGYERNLSLLGDLSRDPQSILAYLPGRSAWAFELYRRHFINA